MDDTGFDAVPSRYAVGKDEAIDIIRATLSHLPEMAQVRDALAAALGDGWESEHPALYEIAYLGYVAGSRMKYGLRCGKKGPAENEIEKARWYGLMVDHVRDPGRFKDPRAYRRAA